MKKALLAAVILIASTTAYASEKDHKHDEHKHDHHEEKKMVKHDAHEHGVAEMNIALIAKEIQIEISTPAYNVIGFEHKPKNKDQEEVVHKAMETLKKPATLFAFKGATCAVEHVDVDSPFSDAHNKEKDKHAHEHHDHGEKKGAHDEDSHSEFAMEYHFDCDASGKPVTIDASQLFVTFPNFSKIRVQWLSSSKQGSTELTSKNKKLSID